MRRRPILYRFLSVDGRQQSRRGICNARKRIVEVHTRFARLADGQPVGQEPGKQALLSHRTGVGWPRWYWRVSGRSHRPTHLLRLLLSSVLNEQPQRETGAEDIAATRSFVRERTNIARIRMLRLRSRQKGKAVGGAKGG